MFSLPYYYFPHTLPWHRALVLSKCNRQPTLRNQCDASLTRPEAGLSAFSLTSVFPNWLTLFLINLYAIVLWSRCSGRYWLFRNQFVRGNDISSRMTLYLPQSLYHQFLRLSRFPPLTYFGQWYRALVSFPCGIVPLIRLVCTGKRDQQQDDPILSYPRTKRYRAPILFEVLKIARTVSEASNIICSRITFPSPPGPVPSLLSYTDPVNS